MSLSEPGDTVIEGQSIRRRRRIVIGLGLLLTAAGIGTWTSWRSIRFRDQAARLNVGMTEAEVIAVMGPPDAAWSSMPPYRVVAYGKSAGLRHAANNFRLDITGNAQLHEAKAAWPVQVKLDENNIVVGLERHGESTGRSMRLKAVGVKRPRTIPNP